MENSDDDIQVENPPKPVSMYGRKGKGHAVEPPSKPSQDDDVEMNVADSAEYAEWNENAKGMYLILNITAFSNYHYRATQRIYDAELCLSKAPSSATSGR